MVLIFSLFLTAPALANHEVSFRIVGFGDQDCTSGTTSLRSNTAGPFDVEVCVTLDGSPLPGHEMTVRITHGDGTIEEIDKVTDGDGKIRFTVRPKAAGTTLVEMCDADGCDYGSVESRAENAPEPEPVASYTGPSNDVGPTEPITDGEDDFTDPYDMEPAESGEGEASIDLKSIRYLGVQDGKARFEFTTRGDACSVFTSGAPFLQLSVFVETPDGQSYIVSWRHNEGTEPDSAGFSERARLPGVSAEIEDWIDDSTGVLAISGVDVPPGSTIRVETWLSTDPLSSGFFDRAEGTVVPASSTPEPEPTATTAAGGDDTTATQPPTTDAPTETTLPGGGNTEGGSFSVWIPIVILGLAVGGFWVYYRTRERGKPPATGGDDEDDDDGDDPRDTPPPVVYGEEIEHKTCGWALYVIDAFGRRQKLRSPGGLVHECCKFVVHVKTQSEAAEHRYSDQEGRTERLRLHHTDKNIADVRVEAQAGTRSGPAGRQDWMQGFGDPTDQDDVSVGEFYQRAPGEDRSDVAAHIEHWERTTVAITLESECPEYRNVYALEGTSDLEFMSTQECTNDAGDPCPVELAATGYVRGAMEGPGRFKTEVEHRTQTTPDDLDREDGTRPTAAHDHKEKDRVTHQHAGNDVSSEAVEQDHLNVVVRNHVQLDAAQIVPEEVWDTTERVSASLETMLNHELEVTTKLTTIGCEANGCCGHGTCNCDAEFTVALSRFGSSIVVEGKAWQLKRKVGPVGWSYELWDLKAL